MRKRYLGRKYPAPSKNCPRDLSACSPSEKAAQILEDMGKPEGFTSFEESVVETCESVLVAEVFNENNHQTAHPAF